MLRFNFINYLYDIVLKNKQGENDMQHIAVAIMYLMIGTVTYRFAEKLNLRATPISLSIGKSLYNSGWIILLASFSTLIPGVPDITSTYILALTVVFMSVFMLKKMKHFKEMLTYDYRYFKEAIESKIKEDFDRVYHKYPELVFTDTIIKMLAENGLLDEWMGTHQAKFNKGDSELFRSYLLLDVMNK